MVAISQTFNQRDDNNEKTAETLVDAARAGVDETPDAAGDAPNRPDLAPTISRRAAVEFAKAAVRAALAKAKANLLAQILAAPVPKPGADIRDRYYRLVRGLALDVVAELGSDDEKAAVGRVLEAEGRSGENAEPDDSVDREAVLKLGKFYNRVASSFVRADATTFDRILEATKAVFPPDELLRPWNVTDKVSSFCDALQNDGATRAEALPLAKRAVEIATATASTLYWGGDGPEPKQRWNVAANAEPGE